MAAVSADRARLQHRLQRSQSRRPVRRFFLPLALARVKLLLEGEAGVFGCMQLRAELTQGRLQAEHLRLVLGKFVDEALHAHRRPRQRRLQLTIVCRRFARGEQEGRPIVGRVRGAQVEGSASGCIEGGRFSSPLHEEHGGAETVCGGCAVQGSIGIDRRCITGVGTSFQQRKHSVLMAVTGGEHQRGAASSVFGDKTRAEADQHSDQVRPGQRGGDMKRSGLVPCIPRIHAHTPSPHQPLQLLAR
mmetsp:Transcript_16969/g.29368  ORF Transcript_16969/g.29368 Transcript_16969/m.29368 type:complete len:246 (-) Transcript_16969:500-1237(-)